MISHDLVRELGEHGARWGEGPGDVQSHRHGVEAGPQSGQVTTVIYVFCMAEFPVDFPYYEFYYLYFMHIVFILLAYNPKT